MRDILHDGKMDYACYDVLISKAVVLSEWLKFRTGMDERTFDHFFRELLEVNKFSIISLNDFAKALENRFEINTTDYLDQWYTAEGLPSFQYFEPFYIPIIDKGRQKYYVSLIVYNKEPYEGLLKIYDTNLYVFLKGKQAKRIGIVLDEPYLTFMPFIAQNLPYEGVALKEKKLTIDNQSKVNKFLDLSGRKNDNMITVDSRLDLANREIVIDNRSYGFSILTQTKEKLLVRLLGRNEYRDAS